jgi:hypothetical protein
MMPSWSSPRPSSRVRAHHAVRFDAADRRGFLSVHAGAGHDRAGQAEHAHQPRARIGRAADDLQRLSPSPVIDASAPAACRHWDAAARPVSTRATRKGQLFGRVLDAFDLKPDGVELARRSRRGRGRRCRGGPSARKRELHAPLPPHEGRHVERVEAVVRSQRRSPSKKARRSSMPYFSMAMRSTPVPKAKPCHFVGIEPAVPRSPCGAPCRSPAPPSSLRPGRRSRELAVLAREQPTSTSTEGSVKGK